MKLCTYATIVAANHEIMLATEVYICKLRLQENKEQEIQYM